MGNFIKNPILLVSILNTKLRDCYPNLENLCDDLDYNKEEIIDFLYSSGYQYDSNLNQFKLIMGD